MNDFSSTTCLDTPTFYHKIDPTITALSNKFIEYRDLLFNEVSAHLINEYENKNRQEQVKMYFCL